MNNFYPHEQACYYCGSVHVAKNGRTHYGKARGRSKACSRQFVFERRNQSLSQEQKRLIGLLLLERISLEGICRVLDAAAYCLYRYMEKLYRQLLTQSYSCAAASARAMRCGAS